MIRARRDHAGVFLGSAAFFWTGSKLGWLIGMAVGGAVLFRLKWPARLKLGGIDSAAVVVVGLGIFAVRFIIILPPAPPAPGARFDYWRAAVQTTLTHPLFGTGPGTFQRPYAQIKSPDAEMARLAHNDYLEQFSDSGIVGGVFYAAWILSGAGDHLAGAFGNPEIRSPSRCSSDCSAGSFKVLGEFGLYIPALAWTALLCWVACPDCLEIK